MIWRFSTLLIYYSSSQEYYLLSQKQRKSLDKKEKPCLPPGKDANMEECIATYIDSQVCKCTVTSSCNLIIFSIWLPILPSCNANFFGETMRQYQIVRYRQAGENMFLSGVLVLLTIMKFQIHFKMCSKKEMGKYKKLYYEIQRDGEMQLFNKSGCIPSKVGKVGFTYEAFL